MSVAVAVVCACSPTLLWSTQDSPFLRATAVPPGTAEARISYLGILSVCLSVCPSVTTRYGFNAR